jgi:hypothetical protein
MIGAKKNTTLEYLAKVQSTKEIYELIKNNWILFMNWFKKLF